MGAAEKLEGKKLVELFAELIQKKVILSMNVVGAGFDSLTCLTGMEETADGNVLLVDPPEDFLNIAGENQRWHLRFNFNGPDRLEYLFSTRGGRFSRQGLRIPFPEHVERLQRRYNFRINTLPGTQMHFKLKKIHGVLDLINVSLGGVYGALIKHNFKFMRGPVLKKEQQVFDSRIVFPGNPGDTIEVKKAEVVRVENDAQEEIHRFALKFCTIEKEEQQRLTQVVYDLQRRYLRFRE
ncbi:PilZ domain-containing protein [Desulfosarcina ovata]|uniref:PilZ domain-containing protein n=2 Tax=Desulfosarcina ovata TaxID=83564 RepID=A0A5K8AFH0_9BACT|nr:PilZ domain-containing protein [Desulfosarcina ovata]BBO84140.1 hypothetical protein DSCO28_47060 [Desulfosarcina ovata subsp. sediminis]BBO90650.1 hypothetical protein DSCOOX_38300 [Desulfosarcina ovata subsp. ovata]